METSFAENTIIVGMDGSPGSLTALRWALKEAVIIGARVRVVHCYLPQTLTDFGFSSPHELHVASAIMLDNEVRVASAEMPVVPEVVTSSVAGGPARMLVAQAEHAAMLVLGVHGQTALRDLVLGRVAQACLRHATCPVVIVGSDSSVDRHEPRVASTAPAA